MAWAKLGIEFSAMRCQQSANAERAATTTLRSLILLWVTTKVGSGTVKATVKNIDLFDRFQRYCIIGETDDY